MADWAAMVASRDESLERARAFAEEVRQIRGWCMTGELYSTHLRPVYNALFEYEEAEREGRPYRSRFERHDMAGDEDALRATMRGAPRLECVGSDGEGGTVVVLVDGP